MFAGTRLWILMALLIACVSGSRYELYREAKTWEEARVTCSREMKRLVHVTEPLQHTRIKNYSPFIFHDFWIGLKEKDSQFLWIDAKAAAFTAWGRGQPKGQSECVRYSATTFLWETHNCSDLLYFMCENEDVPQGKVSGTDTMATGLMMGLSTILGLLLTCVLLLQMSCCRLTTATIMAHFGLGRR